MPAYKDCFEYFELDEERDLPEYGVFCMDAKDCIPALKPFEYYNLMTDGYRSMGYGHEMLSSPSGVPDWRGKDGFLYLSRIDISQEERKRREPIFREKIAPWIEDFEREWRGKFVPEIEEGFQRLKRQEVEKLSNIELRVHFQDWYVYHRRIWDIHMLNMYAAWHIYGLFEDICRELLGMDEQHPQFKVLLTGFDNRLFQVDRGLYLLGSRAIELGLGGTFEAIPDDEQLLSELEKSEAGRKWVEELRQFVDVNGWRTTRVVDVSNPTWVEKPSLALPNVRLSVAKGGVFVLDQEQQRLSREREEIEKDVLSRVPEVKREMFEKLLKASQWVGRWAEEHTFYCEHYGHGLARRALMEFGKRFAGAGFIEEPEDILFLVPDEIIFCAVAGGFGRQNLRKLVRIRKEQYQQNLENPGPIFIGDMSKVGEVISDEIILLRVVAGVPIVKPELKADIYGSNSAAGVAEGVARVVYTPDEFHLVQPGEILVTQSTSPTWTPIFAIVKGVVTDTGGGLTHAVIVGREFGLPVVVGTMEGSRIIKTGDRIRVDGDNCCVYILSQS